MTSQSPIITYLPNYEMLYIYMFWKLTFVFLLQGMTGEAVKYISRAKAIKKLQINLFNFNRLCIIKGIYPIEPKNRIKAQGGNSKFKPLYLKKDIKFLLHDPLIWTMRDEDVSCRFNLSFYCDSYIFTSMIIRLYFCFSITH